MKKLIVFVFAALLCAVPCASPKAAGPSTFTGEISDSACGLHHMMGGASPKKCTLECIQMGSKFVLADEANQKVYGLSDQGKAKPYAGEKVKVTGTLKGSTIKVDSIAPVK